MDEVFFRPEQSAFGCHSDRSEGIFCFPMPATSSHRHSDRSEEKWRNLLLSLQLKLQLSLPLHLLFLSFRSEAEESAVRLGQATSHAPSPILETPGNPPPIIPARH
jgi:hypothetical protein